MNTTTPDPNGGANGTGKGGRKSVRPLFQVGGALEPGHPSYIERMADTVLFEALKQREFCLILAPRQVGKSSLMIQTWSRLQEEGMAVVIVDLQPLGGETNIDRWFGTVVEEIRSDVGLTTDAAAWWAERPHISPPVRFERFIEEVLLQETSGEVAIFFDEVDSALPLPFRDDFFITLRALYNARAHKPIFKRLSCVLIGVASASDFIQNKTRTPFNIGVTIALDDFDITNPDTLTPFYRVFGAEAEPLIHRILYWTGGQPLLTQNLARIAYDWSEAERTADHVDAEVARLYLPHAPFIGSPLSPPAASRHERDRSMERDAHLRFIRDYLLDPQTDVHDTLLCYRAILDGETIVYRPQSPTHTRLRLAGVVKPVNGILTLRNPIYTALFDQEWLMQNFPPDDTVVNRWLASGKNEDYLLRGKALDEEARRQAGRVDVSIEEREFVLAGILLLRHQKAQSRKKTIIALAQLGGGFCLIFMGSTLISNSSYKEPYLESRIELGRLLLLVGGIALLIGVVYSFTILLLYFLSPLSKTLRKRAPKNRESGS